MFRGGVFDSIKRGFKSAKDAIVSITNQIKDVIKRFYKTVIFKFTEMIRKNFKRDILLGIDSLGLDFQKCEFQMISFKDMLTESKLEKTYTLNT